VEDKAIAEARKKKKKAAASLEDNKQTPARFRFSFFLNLKDRKLLQGTMDHCCTQPLSSPPCLRIPRGFTKRTVQSPGSLLGEHLVLTARPGRRLTCPSLGPGCLSLVKFHLQSDSNAASVLEAGTQGCPAWLETHRTSQHVPVPQFPMDAQGNTAPSGEPAGNKHGATDGLSTEVLPEADGCRAAFMPSRAGSSPRRAPCLGTSSHWHPHPRLSSPIWLLPVLWGWWQLLT